MIVILAPHHGGFIGSKVLLTRYHYQLDHSILYMAGNILHCNVDYVLNDWSYPSF